MCEFERSLIAWMDGELEAGKALEVQRHVKACAACSTRAAGYREASLAFADYCEAIARTRKRGRSRWVAWGGAGAAIAAMLLLMLRPRVEPLPFVRPAIPAAPAMALQTVPTNPAAPVKLVHRRPATKRVETPQPAWNLEPSIEIAIPVEAVFAPGAVPPGFSFAAQLSIASDGSPRALRLRP